MQPSLRAVPIRVTLLTVLLAALAGCSSGNGGDTVASSAPAQSTPATVPATDVPATDAPTTTAAPTTTVAETTTTLPAAPVYPLLGTPVADPVAAARPVLVVKIDNAPGARPQTGFNEADIVFEEIVNDNLTRFAMVFQSQGSDPVGPIRSGRIQDINLFGSMNHPLFAWSGGNATVTAAIHASDLIDIGPNRAAVYFRTNRQAPHNLYSNTTALWAQAGPDAAPPTQQFTYRGPDMIAPGDPSAGALVSLDSIDVQWDWDATAGLYRRTMERKQHDDAASGQVTTNNVVVLVMEYLPGISDSPDAQTIGTGEAWVFSAGKVVHGSWSRSDRLQPFTLTGDDGIVIPLTPGRTFIELPRGGHTLPLPAG